MKRDHSNAFDALRLLLALLVVYTHACLLGGFGEEGFSRLCRHQTEAATLAVLGFFSISGFLVAQSFCLRNNWKVFVQARLLRIVPGFYLALLLTAFVFAPAISTFNAGSTGWHWGDAFRFVFKNLPVQLREWHVGGVLSGLPYDGSINGALWSLFPEVLCYGMVLVLGLAGSLYLKRINLLFFVIILLVLHVSLVLFPLGETIAPTLLSLTGWTPFITAFVVGSTLYAYRNELDFGGGQAVFWCVASALLLKFGGWPLLAPAVLPLALIHCAYSFRINLPVDLSYGLYVLHFPVLQVLSASGLPRNGFVLYFGTGLLVTSLFALLSWFLVEKPALQLKQKQQDLRPGQTVPIPG